MKKILKINIINLITLLYLELTYGLLVIGSFNHEQIFSIILYSIFISLVMTILMTVWHEKVNKIVSYIIYSIICFWYAL